MNLKGKTVSTCLAAFLLFSFKADETNSCSFIDDLKEISQTEFETSDRYTIAETDLKKLSPENYKILYGEDYSDSDQNFAMGKFRIQKNRFGIISLKKTFECDHPIDIIFLSIIDNCKNIFTSEIAIEDNEVIQYKISSILEKKKGIISIRKEFSSEYAVEPGSKTDTIFSEAYRIDLKTLDTISHKAHFETVNLD